MCRSGGSFFGRARARLLSLIARRFVLCGFAGGGRSRFLGSLLLSSGSSLLLRTRPRSRTRTAQEPATTGQSEHPPPLETQSNHFILFVRRREIQSLRDWRNHT